MKRALTYCLTLLLLSGAFCPQAAASDICHELSYRRFTTHDGLPQMQTETVWQDSRGYIYIGTLSGFVRYDGRTLTPFLRGRRENIVGFQEVAGDVRAMGFVREWKVRADKASMQPIDPEGHLLLNNLNAADLPTGFVLLEDSQEQNRVLCSLDGSGIHHILALPLLDEMTPDRKMYLDSSLLFVPTPKGLYVAEGEQVRRLSRKSDVLSLIRSGEDLLALAADGIYKVSGDSLSLLYAHRFQDPDYGLSVRQNRKGQLLIADSHTIWIYDGALAEPMRQLYSGINLIRGIFIDRWDRLWAATYQGAYCFFHCNFSNHRLTDENDIARAIAFSGGKQVLGTLNGKVLFDGEVLSSLDGNFYAPGAAVLDREVYMAGNGDIAAVQEGSLRWLGLPCDRYRFVAPSGGHLIIGGRSDVLSYDPRGGHLDTLTTQIIHPWCAADDGQGRLWVSGNPGLYCLTSGAHGGTAVKKVKDTPSTLVITAMATDGQGKVCFAQGDSLFAIHGGVIRKMAEALPSLSGHEIRSIHLSPRGYLIAATIDRLMVARLDEECRASDIHCFDVHSGFTTIEPLQGAMAEDEDGTVWLAGLEGMTSFRPADLLSDNQDSTLVEAPRPWWQRWWAWLAAAGILSFAVWRAARWFTQRQSSRKMAQLMREKQQKDLQLSAVRLKAIPHFHANVLSSIEYFVMNHSADAASHYLKLYSDFTARTLSDIDRPARTVAEEIDYLRNYLELEQLRYGERLQYSITVDPDADQKVLLPTMLLHTYCENAVKHGIAAKSGTGHVEVIIRRERRSDADGILVLVRDDGVGRAEAAHSGEPSTKQGLKILQQQIELYNRANRHAIQQSVTDLVDEAGRPAGTCFETWVPADYQY